MPFELHVPIGPSAPSEYTDFRQYLELDSQAFSAAHPLLITKFVGPLDPLIPDAFEDLADFIPDDYMTMKAPFDGTLFRDSTNPDFIIIQLDQVKYTEQISDNSIPILSKVTHAYMGPVTLFEDIETTLSDFPADYIKVTAGQALGELSFRDYHLGFFIRSDLDAVWIDSASVMHYFVDQSHPLLDSAGSPQTIEFTGPTAREGERLAFPTPGTNHFMARIEQEEFTFQIYSHAGFIENPTPYLRSKLLPFSSDDNYTFFQVGLTGEIVQSSPGSKVSLEMNRIVLPIEDSYHQIYETLDISPGDTVRMRDTFHNFISEPVEVEEGKSIPFQRFELRVQFLPRNNSELWDFAFFQDDVEILREEYLERNLPVPPRNWFTIPRRESLDFDVRNLFLQHDYATIIRTDAFWPDRRDKTNSNWNDTSDDITLGEDDIRQTAEFIQSRFNHYVLDETISEFNEDQRSRISTKLYVTRAFINPKLNQKRNFSELHPQQFGRSIEFKPFVPKAAYRERLIRALGKACIDFLSELPLVNSASQEFLYRYLHFAKFQRQLWSVRVEQTNLVISDKPITISDTNSIDIQNSFEIVDQLTINSTLDAEQKAHRVSIAWQIPNVLEKIIVPVAPAGPGVNPVVAEDVQKTNLIFLATEEGNTPSDLEEQIALDDKAETFRAWFAKKFPQDITRTVETISLYDVYNELRLFDKSPFRIRNMVVVSHAGPNHVLLRATAKPEEDPELWQSFTENLESLKQLYPPGVKFHPEMLIENLPGVRPQRWNIRSLIKLSNATKIRLREVFSAAELIILSGCKTDTETFPDSSTFCGVLSRLTNTDVYGANHSSVSLALTNDGQWQWHGLAFDGSPGDHRGTPFVPGNAPTDLRDPLTVISAFAEYDNEEATDGSRILKFRNDPANLVPPDQEFDLIKHYTTYFTHRFAPDKRSD